MTQEDLLRYGIAPVELASQQTNPTLNDVVNAAVPNNSVDIVSSGGQPYSLANGLLDAQKVQDAASIMAAMQNAQSGPATITSQPNYAGAAEQILQAAQAAAQTAQPAPEQDDGQTMSNKAFTAGTNQANAQYQQQKVNEAQQQAQQAKQQADFKNGFQQGLLGDVYTPMTFPQKQAANILTKYKQDWQTLSNAAAQAEEAGDYDSRDTLIAARDQVASSAEQYRGTLGDMGLSKAFGADGTYQDALTANNTDTNRALQQLFAGDMSSGQYYDQQYDELVRAGMTEKGAEQEAARRAGRYQQQRMALLSNSIKNYGMSDRNSLNDIGVMLLGRMAQEDGTAANLYAQMMPGPKEDYTIDRGRENMALQNDYNAQMEAIKYQYALAKQTHNAELQAQLKALAAQLQLDAKLQGYQWNVDRGFTPNGGSVKAPGGTKGANGANGDEPKLSADQKKAHLAFKNAYKEYSSFLKGYHPNMTKKEKDAFYDKAGDLNDKIQGIVNGMDKFFEPEDIAIYQQDATNLYNIRRQIGARDGRVEPGVIYNDESANSNPSNEQSPDNDDIERITADDVPGLKNSDSIGASEDPDNPDDANFWLH